MAFSEASTQNKCVKWFRNKYCLKGMNPKYSIFSVPNESTYNNKKFIATGMLPGVSDTIVVLDGKVLFIEFKTATGKQSERQKDFEDTVKALGHPYFICRNFDDFVCIIENYL